MSHFSVLVLADEELDRPQAEEYVTNVLAPFDENTAVDPRKERCYCVNTKVREYVRENLDPPYVEYRDDLRDQLQDLSKRVREAGNGELDFFDAEEGVAQLPEGSTREAFQKEYDALDEEWKAHLARWDADRKKVSELHPDYDKPEDDCEECGGTGWTTTTYNPASKWDWWSIGGRWTGVLNEDYDPEQDPRNFTPCTLCGGTGTRKDGMHGPGGCNGCRGTGTARNWHNAETDFDVMPLSSVRVDPAGLFFAVVTPDGEWYERGQMGWWASVTNEKPKDEWQGELRSIVEQHPNATAIVVDCHI